MDEAGEPPAAPVSGFQLYKQGAEARLWLGRFLGRSAVAKERFPKTYRHPELDRQLTRDRLKGELKSIVRAKAAGVRTPTVLLADADSGLIVMEYVETAETARDYIRRTDDQGALGRLAAALGRAVAGLHQRGIIHGDLTTSNVLVDNGDPGDLVLIDFGLGFAEGSAEDKGVDLYVLERAFLSTHPDSEAVFSAVMDSYRNSLANKKMRSDVMAKFEEIRMRGRKRTMVG